VTEKGRVKPVRQAALAAWGALTPVTDWWLRREHDQLSELVCKLGGSTMDYETQREEGEDE